MSTRKPYQSIVVTGSIAYDEIMDFPGQFVEYFHPEKLHQINVSFVVNRLEKQLGGIATNISYNASLLTKKPIKILSSVGKDGSPFVEFYKSRGIDYSGLLTDTELYTSTGKVITDIKDNQIWGFYYGALEKAKNIVWGDHIDKDSLVIISPTHVEAFLGVQRYVIEHKIDYIYDPGMAITWIDEHDLRQGIDHCKYLIGNDYEIAQILRRLNLSIVDLLNRDITVITTLGEQGVQLVHKDHELQVGGFAVKKVLDPTGAGDAWRGGFAAGIMEGMTLKDCMIQANALASFAVERYGTVNHDPSPAEMDKRKKSIINNLSNS